VSKQNESVVEFDQIFDQLRPKKFSDRSKIIPLFQPIQILPIT